MHYAYKPSRCILADKKLCKMKTIGFGHPSMSNSWNKNLKIVNAIIVDHINVILRYYLRPLQSQAKANAFHRLMSSLIYQMGTSK